MNLPWRLWVFGLMLLAILFAGFGALPKLGGDWWPVAGIWLAATLAAYGLSVWTAMCLLTLGLATDLMTDAPLGAWPLAFLMAYVVAAIAWEQYPPLNRYIVEGLALVGGMVAVAIALGLAAGLAGYTGFSRTGLLTDFAATFLLYPVVRLFLLPKEVREVRR